MSIQNNKLGDPERLVVSPRRARQMLDCGNTRLYELIKNNELESFLDGRSRKIVVASIRAYVARKLAAAVVATDAVKPPRRRIRQRKSSEVTAATHPTRRTRHD
jgi:hypothetical protein